MNTRFPFFGERIVLTGDVLSLRLIVSVSDGNEWDKSLWSYLQEMRSKLESEIKETIKKSLGPQFEIQSITFRQGSIDVLIYIGTVYYIISSYKDFYESIELLVSQLKTLLARFFRHIERPISVYGTWSPGPALTRAEALISSYGPVDAFRILLWYVILSHAALLTVLLWLIIRH